MKQMEIKRAIHWIARSSLALVFEVFFDSFPITYGVD